MIMHQLNWTHFFFGYKYPTCFFLFYFIDYFVMLLGVKNVHLVECWGTAFGLHDGLYLFLYILFDRSINRVSITVSSQFVALETTVVMVLWLLVTCITLDISRQFVIQSVLLSSLCWSCYASMEYNLKLKTLECGVILYIHIYGGCWICLIMIILEDVLIWWRNFAAGITLSPFHLSGRSAVGLVKGLWHYCRCNVWFLIPW